MRTLVSAVVAISLSALAVGPVYASGPDWLLGIKMKYWIDIIVVLLILNLICCWWRKR